MVDMVLGSNVTLTNVVGREEREDDEAEAFKACALTLVYYLPYYLLSYDG